jgi:hypothetical protein
MTIRDRAYNVIKSLKKVWFEEYCDAQKEIEKALQEAIEEEREACAKIAHDDDCVFVTKNDIRDAIRARKTL